jgi:hypothetical protein
LGGVQVIRIAIAQPGFPDYDDLDRSDNYWYTLSSVKLESQSERRQERFMQSIISFEEVLVCAPPGVKSIG